MNDAFQFSDATANPEQSGTLPPNGIASTVPNFTHPDDVVNDPKMTKAEKRAVLASWISDAHAVKDAPAFRQLESGAVVRADDILQALRALDAHGDQTNDSKPDRVWRIPFARRQGTFSARWRSKAARRTGRDDDDDPPPCPASAAVPVRMAFVAACGGRPGWAATRMVART